MKNHYEAYKQASHTVSKTRQIVMLYDGIIRFIKQARHATEHGRIEERYNLLVKASKVVIGLQGCLDFDHDQSVATSLYDYYNQVDARLMALHRSKELSDYDSLLEDIKQMRAMWHNIDAATEAGADVMQPADVASPAAPENKALAQPQTLPESAKAPQRSAQDVAKQHAAHKQTELSNVFVSA